MQIVMTPVQMLTDPLVTRYLRGEEKVGLYEEVLQLYVSTPGSGCVV